MGSKYFNKENIKIKLKHFTLPQLFYSFLIMAIYAPAMVYAGADLFDWLYNLTGYSFFTGGYKLLMVMLIMPVVIIIIFYIKYGRKSVEIFSFNNSKWSSIFFTATFPVIIGFISAGAVFSHFIDLKKRLHTIENVKQIHHHPDSTDAYKINQYALYYEGYHYSFHVERIQKGGKHNHYYVTEVEVHILCPFIKDLYESDDTSSWTVLAAFSYSKQLNKVYGEESEEVKNAVSDLLTQFYSRQPIVYFKETNEYRRLLTSYFNNDHRSIERSDVLEAYFEEYEPYNGYGDLLIAVYIWMGGNFLSFFFIFFTNLKKDEFYYRGFNPNKENDLKI